MAAAVTMTYGIFSMTDSLVTNRHQLLFSFADIIVSILVFSLILFVVLLAIFIVCRGRIFDLALCVALSFLVCGYLQSTFFNSGLGQLMGQSLGWRDLGVSSVLLNLAFWLLVMGIVFFLGFSKRPRLRKAYDRSLFFVPALLIAVQVIAFFSIVPPLSEWATDRGSREMGVLSRETLFEVSSQSNIVVFIVDTMDDNFLDMLLEEDPHVFDSLDGFTRFTNNMSVYNLTFPSIAHLITDVPLDYTVYYPYYLDDAYAQGNIFIKDIHDRGFTCNLYTEKPLSYWDESQLVAFTDNTGVGSFTLRVAKTPIQLFRLSLLKSAPLALKSLFWLHPEMLNVENIATWENGTVPYSCDDPRFYRELHDNRLSAHNDEPCFSFYHLFGFHAPYTMDAQARYVRGGTQDIEQFQGTFFIIDEYLEQMKEQGIYKDATIIITGDHPLHTSWQAPDEPMLVGLFVKPAGSEGSPLAYNNAPVALPNLRATCVEASGGDPRPWGKTYFEVEEGERTIREYYHLFTGEDKKSYMSHHRVTGDARNWDNWELVEIIPL